MSISEDNVLKRMVSVDKQRLDLELQSSDSSRLGCLLLLGFILLTELSGEVLTGGMQLENSVKFYISLAVILIMSM